MPRTHDAVKNLKTANGRSAPEQQAPTNRFKALALSPQAISAIKWLALLLMLVDHTNKYVLAESHPWMYAMGRSCAPLFAVVLGYNLASRDLLANGGYLRLVQRLALAGLLASVPFVVLNKLPGGWWPLNIMFTLLVAVAAAWLLEIRKPLATVTACLVIAWGGALCEFWWPAVGLVLCVWAYQRQPSALMAFASIVCLALFWFVNGNLYAFAAVPLVWFIHRFWTWELPRMKWLFYAFYPAHLAAFWLYLQLR